MEILSIDDEVETLEVKKSIVYKILGYDYIWRKKYKQDLHKYDLIICNGEYGFMIKHKNAIQVYHGSAFGYYINISNNLNFVSKLKLLINVIKTYFASKNKFVIAVSNNAKYYLNLSRIKVDKIMPNSARPEFKNLHKKRNGRVLFVGVPSVFKGLNILFEICKLGLDVDCISPTPVHNPLTWIGRIEKSEELNEVYNNYSCMILPSMYEGMSLALLEAMATGLPIITTDVGFYEEIVKECPLFVVNRQDKSAVELAVDFVNRIKLVTENFEHYSKLSENIYIEKYGYDKFKSR